MPVAAARLPWLLFSRVLGVLVQYYDSDHVKNPNPLGDTPYDRFDRVRQAIVAVCRRYGPVCPEDQFNGDGTVTDYGFFVADDQYNSELFHYAEIHNRDVITTKWIHNIQDTLRRFKGWGLCLMNIRFGYVILFADRILITGPPFVNCSTVDDVIQTARRCVNDRIAQAEPLQIDTLTKESIEGVRETGCYKCLTMFRIDQVEQFSSHRHQSALCPSCSTTTMIYSTSDHEALSASLHVVNQMAYGA